MRKIINVRSPDPRFFIKIRRIVRRRRRGLGLDSNGRGDGLAEESIPVGPCEKGVVHDLADAPGAEPRVGSDLQEARDELLRLEAPGDGGVEAEETVHDVAKQQLADRLAERLAARQHFVEQQAEAPEVDRVGVVVAQQGFGGDVLWSPECGVCPSGSDC